MSRLDVDALLRRAVERSGDLAGVAVRVTRSDTASWASATFTGARHELAVEGAAGAALDRWLGALPETDLPLRGHLVADLKIVAIARDDGVTRATIEALTVEER